MNIFNIAGASAEQTFNNLGGFKRLIQNNKFHDNLKVFRKDNTFNGILLPLHL